MAEESAVRVCVRVRPLIAREECASEGAEPVQFFWKADQKSIHQIDDGNSTKSFSFDRVFTADETTSQLYNNIAKPLVVSTVEGYNGTIFAYGQTSSGKTFTMMGSERTPGVIPLAVEDVFQTIKNFPKKEFLLRVSYMEIYNETVTDLLVDSWKRKPLEVREQINKNIYVADLTEELVTSLAQVLAWIRKGEKNRHYGKTKMNQRSSRSHTIFRMILESRERSDPASGESGDGAIIVSHLNLVDLAGSERASQTGAEGARFKEGCNINRSLFTLGQVIKKLTDENQKGFTNYRDSKLTRILQNSLGGNAKTVIICTITPVTLDETLSTLQFASTAKKMKNDPHVTEVSDDGALLKRYRNEIVDLKRRLHEVSSVTQTTVTEKEVLSQLLQEKDQLQREQEDRIRNLTKLLVTSSNLVPVQKMPKRRVTWGGKMLKVGHPAAREDGSSDLSFAESFTRKRKADFSCLELAEDDEEFESNWGIPDEPSDEMELSQSSVAVRSFGESPRDFMSPDRLQELSGKVSGLEMQLEKEIQEKEEATSKAETLHGRVAELQLQVQTEAQQKQETLEKMQTIEQRTADLEVLLQTEVQQRLEATEKAEMLELRVTDLERQLAEQSDSNEQMRKEFAETIQLCETLASEKDVVAAERDYLKQELGMFIEQMESLEKEKAALSQELEEKREVEEFKSLEEACRREHEKELENEILSLKKAAESFEVQRLELQNKLESLSEQLKKKTAFAEELQSMSGKDLVQEVVELRRSLDDAERLGRDTKKEWAVLRSQNISLEETNVTLTGSHEKMEAEIKSLRFQLETEKSRYRKMQSDLQKELTVTFDENTKLTSLLDGKVPRNLIDSVELERTAANLNKELTASRQAEEALRAQLDELASFQTLPDKVDTLTKQLEEREQEQAALQGKLSEMQQLMEDLKEKLADSEASRTTEEEISRELQEQIGQLNEELQCVRAEKAALQSEQDAGVQSYAEETEKLLSTVTSLTAERDQLRVKLQEHVDKGAEAQLSLQSLQHELQEKHSDLVRTYEQKESDLGENMSRLSQELQCVQDEKEALLMTVQSSSEEVEKLLTAVASLTAERDQLKVDLQENVEMMIENQEELRTALDKNREQKKQIKALEAQINELDGLPRDMNKQLGELQTRVQTLTEELERAESERLLSESTANTQTSTEEVEKLLCRLTSLSEERDQLQEMLEGLRQEKQQLRAELEDRIETLQSEGSSTQELLKSVQEELLAQKNMVCDLKKQSQEKESSLNQQVRTLADKLERVEAERSHLLSERELHTQTSTEEVEKLLCRLTSLSEERDQLQEMLEGLRQEKQQLRAELEDRMDMVQQLCSQPPSLREEQDAQRRLQLEEHLERSKEEMRQLQSDLQENVKLMTENQEELAASQEKIRVLQDEISMLKSQRVEVERSDKDAGSTLQLQELKDQVQTLTEELERAESERLLSESTANTQTSTEEVEKLLCRLTSLSEERDQLQEMLEGLRQEKQQLRAELEDRIETLQSEGSSTQELLKSVQEELLAQKNMVCDLKKQSQEKESSLNQQVRTLADKLERVEAERSHLLSERELHTQTSTEEVEKLLCRLTSLSEERDQLQEMLEGLRQEKQQLRAELEDRMEPLQSELITLTQKLQTTEAEKDLLLSEKEASQQTSTEEMEKLLCRLTSLSEERDQLQEMLEGLRQEKQQLRAELEDRMDMMSAIQDQLSQQEQLNVQQQSERGEQEAKLQREMMELKEQLQIHRERRAQAETEAGEAQQLLSEAKATTAALREQLSSSEQSTSGAKETLSSRLQDSTRQLEESFKKFQHFIDTCCDFDSASLDIALTEQRSLKHPSLPKATTDAYVAVFQLGKSTHENLKKIKELLCEKALGYRNMFEELVKKDLAIFEERRLQDVLLCRAQAPSYSVKDEDFHALWEHRLPELLDRRQLYLQKMSSFLEKLWANMTSYLHELRSELEERSKFREELRVLTTNQPISSSRLDSILSTECDHRSAGTQRQARLLQSITEEQMGPSEELKQLEAEAESQLSEVKSKTSTLLQTLEGAPLQTVASLLKETQQLAFQLQQAEEKIKALHIQNEYLEEAQFKANTSVSNHKEATQLLQTELQDSLALVEERENTIQALKSKIRESEKKSSPSVVELENLKTKLLQMEMKLSLASDEHQQEVQRMTQLLKEKEELLRKLKETLRKSQQEGEETFLQGKDLHARLTNPRGSVISSSVLLEKSKLEEEVKQLQVKTAELESLVSSQQAEISKWKNRAIKLKVRSKAEEDKLQSPGTPTKRGLPMISDSSKLLSSPKKIPITPKKLLDTPRKDLESPRKLLDSPKASLLNSPKSRFFDMGGSSRTLSRNRPKQFFDNSSLGSIPDAAVDTDRKEWWPMSPKQEEMCKTQ
ncbi:centromere-associated protein E isoform X1 [Archocentrus centrarchus]|uniref:centromere-associated protein E isoform X1 n=1 Tax=Archocentrus centrarchus TaxID=63155 RepID=UPI0011EA01D6|nr:centromere-associated protein E-like isoform X1 [Archocentrus centrarchus]